MTRRAPPSSALSDRPTSGLILNAGALALGWREKFRIADTIGAFDRSRLRGNRLSQGPRRERLNVLESHRRIRLKQPRDPRDIPLGESLSSDTLSGRPSRTEEIHGEVHKLRSPGL